MFKALFGILVIVIALALLVAVVYALAGVEVPGVVQPLAEAADAIVNLVP